MIGMLISRHRKKIGPVIVFAVAMVVWVILYPKIVSSQALSGFLEFTARITHFSLRLLGTQCEINGTIISSPVFSIRVGHECTAIIPMLILFSAVLAFPSTIKQKLSCILIGLPVLFVLNLVRVVTLYYIGVYIPDFLETAHFIVWQSVMIVAVIGLWLLWVGKVVNVSSA